MRRVGGPSQAVDADDTVQAVCESVRQALEDKLGRKFEEYTAMKVSKQVVAGTNYFVKVHLGNQEYVHIRIYKPLPGQGDPQLHSYQEGKTAEEEVSYFD